MCSLLRDSPWDPYTELLPMREQLSANLVTAIHKRREITLAGDTRSDRVLALRRHHRRVTLARRPRRSPLLAGPGYLDTPALAAAPVILRHASGRCRRRGGRRG